MPRDDNARFAELLAQAEQLKPGNLEAVESLIEAGVRLALSDTQRSQLRHTINDCTCKQIGLRALGKDWDRAERRYKAESAPTRAEIAARQAVEETKCADTRRREREKLAAEAAALANRPDLIEHAADIAQALGVVDERKAIKATYIAMSSRVLAEKRVISILRSGVTGGGKSFLIENIVPLFPEDCMVDITTGSARSLVYLIDNEGEHALSHKALVLGETAGFIASSEKEDNPATTQVRELLTKGNTTHLVSLKNKKGGFTTHKIKVRGPIALITSSARLNLDDEMRSRLLEIPTNEGKKATRKIRRAQLSGETRRRAERAAKDVAELVAFQRWLQAEAPVDVVIPDELLDAIAAVGGIPDTIPTRRDIPLFKLAIQACAAIHMARRQRDAEGRVLAELEDYEAAHEAFDDFLAAAYSRKLLPNEIEVLDAIETLIAKSRKKRAETELTAAQARERLPEDHLDLNEPKAKLTYSEIMDHIAVKQRRMLSQRVERLRKAKAI